MNNNALTDEALFVSDMHGKPVNKLLLIIVAAAVNEFT